MARSKEFDEAAVLEKAMLLFLDQGYEKTSMQDLVEHMGIHRRSLYDTFGDKHALFMRSLRLYKSKVDDRLGQAALNAPSALEGIRLVFRAMTDRAPEEPKGCLLVNTAVELGPRDEEAERLTDESFCKLEELLKLLIQRGQANGEIVNELDSQATAESLHTTLLGIRVLARTSAPKEKLLRIASVALSSLEKD
ncbi:TetR/AcrR family transcriptional regulator [Saccharibacillus sacchari]|uniref:TetR/AcrR family transcriptional regulator n=1 Tax=Saccharibacillus sacchari TaxID=456493 RepID=A0ACC6P7C4_9BACL